MIKIKYLIHNLLAFFYRKKANQQFGYFEGEVIAKWLKDKESDDRTMELISNFAYSDPSGKLWEAKKGKCIDGASIPKKLWENIGSPYVGDYRRATVLHDVACKDKLEKHDDVHRMFYYAMLCDGVNSFKAMLMYQAVRFFGPKWNSEKREKELSNREVEHQASYDMTQTDFSRLEMAVNKVMQGDGEDLDLEQLNLLIDDNISQK